MIVRLSYSLNTRSSAKLGIGHNTLKTTRLSWKLNFHTNHYLHAPKSVQIADISYADSLGRYATVVDKLSSVSGFSASEMISILSDQSNAEYPNLSKHELHPIKEMGYCGTLATIIMDLESRTMKVREGNPTSSSFSIDNFMEYSV